MNDIIELTIYPFEKILILLQNIKISNVSLYSIIAGAVILGLIFSLFFSSISGLGSGSSKKEKNKKEGDSN